MIFTLSTRNKSAARTFPFHECHFFAVLVHDILPPVNPPAQRACAIANFHVRVVSQNRVARRLLINLTASTVVQVHNLTYKLTDYSQGYLRRSYLQNKERRKKKWKMLYNYVSLNGTPECRTLWPRFGSLNFITTTESAN